MIRRLSFFLLAVLAIILMSLPATSAHAQSTGERARDAAIADLNQRIPNIGEPNSWSYTVLSTFATEDSLRCPLVEGSPLPQQVRVYQVRLVYLGVPYIYHVSEDTSIVVACDEKLLSPTTPENTPAPNPSPAAPQACLLAATGANVRDFPAVDGSQIIGTARSGVNYPVVARTPDNNWYLIDYANSVQGWVGSSVSSVSGDCAAVEVRQPAASTRQPTDDTPAGQSATPTSAFSGQPCIVGGADVPLHRAASQDSRVVGSLRSGRTFRAQARNDQRTWLYLTVDGVAGWVPFSAVQSSGGCTNLPVQESAADECPPDFEGYLPPRLRVESETGATVAEGLILSLYQQPSTDSLLVNNLPSGSQLTQIIDGPVCADERVWWQVDYQGQQGWVQESNATTDEYFILPVTPIESAFPALTPDSISLIVQRGRLAVDAAHLAWSPDGGLIALATEDGVLIYSYPALEELPDLTQKLAIPASIDETTALAFDASSRHLAAGYASGVVRLLDLESTEVFVLVGRQPVTALDFRADNLLAVAGASQASDTPAGEILVWDVAQLNPTTGIAPQTYRQQVEAPALDVAFAAPASTLLYIATAAGVQALDFSSGAALFSSSYTAEPPHPQLAYAGQASTPGMLYADGDSLWLVQAGQDGLEALQLLTFDDRALRAMAVTGAGDAALLALAFEDEDGTGQLYFYNLPTGEAPLHELDLPAGGLMFGPDGAVLAVRRTDGGLEWWSLGQE